MVNVVEISGLRKSYGREEVLHGIDLNVPRGRLVGFLGPNGAGKTTTIRILMGLISATSGTAQLLGRPARSAGYQSRSRIGYLPGEVRLYTNYTGRATLDFLAAARRLDCRDEIKRLADRLDLDLRKQVRKFSSGMKQKLGLIASLMHRPELLILDEPTTGLDPLVRKSVFDELRQFVERGHTVLFSSHTLSEVEELADEVIILRDGRVIEHELIGELRRRALRRVTIVFTTPQDVPQELPDNLTLIKRRNSTVEATWSGKIDRLISWLGGQSLADVTVEQPDLEDLFLTYYSDGKPATGESNE